MSSTTILRGHQLKAKPTTLISQSLTIIRKLLATDQFQRAGLTTAEMYRLALKEVPSPYFEAQDIYDNDRDSMEIRYTKSRQRKVPPPSPPHVDHPIRSMRFLKTRILPILEGLKEIRMTMGKRVHSIPESKIDAKTKGNKNRNGKPGGAGYGTSSASSTTTTTSSPPSLISHSVHLWMPTQKPKKVAKKIEGGSSLSDVLGREVGLGADWGHLSRRRRRGREEKVEHDLDVMLRLRKAERQEKKRVIWEGLVRKEEGKKERD